MISFHRLSFALGATKHFRPKLCSWLGRHHVGAEGGVLVEYFYHHADERTDDGEEGEKKGNEKKKDCGICCAALR